MAKHTNLSSLFTAIADAIRAKKGLAAGTKIVADNFPDEIAGIEIGGGIDTTISTNAATKNDIRTGKKAYVNGSLITGEFAGIDTTISTNAATKNHILSDKKAYVNGSLVTGNIPSKGADTYTPGTDTQTIDSGYYLSGTQYIEGDSNLKGSNIKKGVSIFGVNGTYEPDIGTCTVALSATGIVRITAVEHIQYVSGELTRVTNTYNKASVTLNNVVSDSIMFVTVNTYVDVNSSTMNGIQCIESADYYLVLRITASGSTASAAFVEGIDILD